MFAKMRGTEHDMIDSCLKPDAGRGKSKMNDRRGCFFLTGSQSARTALCMRIQMSCGGSQVRFRPMDPC